MSDTPEATPAAEAPATSAPAETPVTAESPAATETAATDTALSEEFRPRIRMDTTDGEIIIALWPESAPRTVENFQRLIHDGYYDGLTFHRIVPTFIIQAGCPHGDGTGGPGYNIAPEFNDRPHDVGTVSMARTADPNSAGSQFFICLNRENCQHLDGQYTAFGQVIRGMDTVERIAAATLEHPDLFKPLSPPQILHAREMMHDES